LSPAIVARLLPLVALAVTTGLLGFTIHKGRRLGLTKRPLLLGGLILGALPLLYLELVWLELLSPRYLRFEHETLAPICAAAVGFVALRLCRVPGTTTRVRRVTTELFVMLSAVALGLGVLAPEIGKPLDKLTILIAVDRSRSIDLVPNAESRLRAELDVAERSMGPDDRIGIIAFGADAAIEDPPRPRSDQRTPQRADVGRDATDLASAVRRSLAEVPPDTAARIVLLTDGVATRGDVLEAAASALAAEVPIDAVALDQRVVPDVRVVALRMPSRADEKEPMELRVVTSSPKAADVEIRIKRDEVLIRKARAKIEAGEDVLRIREIASSPGLHQYDVEITALDPALDQAPEDNAASAFVRVRGTSTALVLEGDPGKHVAMVHALEQAGFRVTSATTPGVPTDLAGFAGYDVVVLSDVRASDLAATQIDALASYTRDFGGGLVLMGGDRSMGPGGYARTAIEEVSPLSFDLKQERRRASLAEVISIDYSGSMGARVGSDTKLDLANEASARSASLLGAGDRLGVAHVDTTNAWTIPLGPVTNPKAIGAKIRSVGVGGGGIYVDLALDEAYSALARERVNLKHVLLFADGSDAERMAGCRTKVGDAFKRGITTSVVALGKGSDVPELEVLARVGGGRFYLIEDATRLPSVFTQETIIAAKSSINEVDFVPSLAAPSPALRGVDLSAAPALKGYVVTVPKGRAAVHLIGPENDPILASWSVGVGRSAAFTSDFKDRWGEKWTGFAAASRLFGQIARDVARKAEDPRVRLEADAVGGELHVRATVVGDDGRAQTFRRLAIAVGGPDGFTRKMSLEAVGAGAYAATIPLARPGKYLATAVDEISNEMVGSAGAVLNAGQEMRPTGTDRALLTRVASMTGGKVRDSLAGVFRDRATTRFAYKPLSAFLLVAAAAFLLLGVAARKFAMPEAVVNFLARRQAGRSQRRRERDERRSRDAGSAPTNEERGASAAATADALSRLATRPKSTESSAGDDARAAGGAAAIPWRAPPVSTESTSLSGAAPASATPPPASPTSPAHTKPTANAAGAAAGTKPKSAAEILLEKRRGQRSLPFLRRQPVLSHHRRGGRHPAPHVLRFDRPPVWPSFRLPRWEALSPRPLCDAAGDRRQPPARRPRGARVLPRERRSRRRRTARFRAPRGDLFGLLCRPERTHRCGVPHAPASSGGGRPRRLGRVVDWQHHRPLDDV
jgi:Ca-activated chloride channel homolog